MGVPDMQKEKRKASIYSIHCDTKDPTDYIVEPKITRYNLEPCVLHNLLRAVSVFKAEWRMTILER
jgi:hypothetical protein